MGYKNREIEIKMEVSGGTLESTYEAICNLVASKVKKLYPNYSTDDDEIIGKATDIYWNAPRNGIGDFVRLRKTSKGGQITLKSTDKGSNLDRVEIDLEVPDYKQAKELMISLHGEPKAQVTKKYTVYFLENEFTNISVYQVRGDGRIFVEVEAKTRTRLKEIIKELLKSDDKEWNPLIWTWIQSSIYEMFVCGKKAKEANIKDFLG